MPSILITGANRGLGLEFARQYAADGWDIVATCRDPAHARELRAIETAGGELQVEKLDVTDQAAILGLSARHAGRPLDVLLNNAGIIGPLPVTEHIHRQRFGGIDYALWEQVLRTNTFGPVMMAEAFLPHLLAGEQKKIATLSSSVGSINERATPAMAYATSKATLNKALRLLAVQLRDQGISVGIFCPGYVQTRMDFGTADVTPQASVTALRRLIGQLSPAQSGRFQRYNGEIVAW